MGIGRMEGGGDRWKVSRVSAAAIVMSERFGFKGEVLVGKSERKGMGEES